MNRDDPFVNSFYKKYLYHPSKYTRPNYRRYYHHSRYISPNFHHYKHYSPNYRKYYHHSRYISPNYRKYYKSKQYNNLYRYNYESRNIRNNQNSTNFTYSPPKKYRNIFNSSKILKHPIIINEPP